MSELMAVTGAFGYSGKYIAQRLLDAGEHVITLTNSPHRPDPFAGAVEARPLCFDDAPRLAENLRGVRVLFNTYWVRFNHRSFTHAEAVRNTRVLFRAAQEAGVERVVHVSITRPALDSPLEYFSGKAVLERALEHSGLSYAILRPTVLFGKEDILINNIAWMLLRFPVFGVFGDGAYKLQPIHVDDLAALAVAQATSQENTIINAIGPETFSFRELVAAVGEAIGKRRPIVPLPPILAYMAGRAVGMLLRDEVVTWPEVQGLMAGLLCVDAPPAGATRLTDWAREHAETLGKRYANELARRASREAAYFA